ncbi:MAG: hypothetical protein JNL82_14560 [Myxococcales bacterium]|nr:hypothetical protein [Myxococcales bacterium]
MSRFRELLTRAAAWWRAHRLARAEALELAAAKLQQRADQHSRDGEVLRALRSRERAAILNRRAAQLRERAGEE